MRTYFIIVITECNNCKSSNVIARTTSPRSWKYGPKCKCGAQVGPMQWGYIRKVRADSQFKALKKYKKDRLFVKAM